ncbi:MAG TPA: enoyl-CoA hydratase/isomerase family protein [Terriglobia bacterium]|nr:enoyl-CoA hydratase/isomerase family protein [Terriglobia bacterium]
MKVEATVLYQEKKRSGGEWAEITLNRPQKGNAITLPMLDEIEGYVHGLKAAKNIRALVLRGNGRFFCTGGDIEAWGALTPNAMSNQWVLRGIQVLEMVAALPQPVIAAISGHALGGGLELALMADLRVAVKAAKLGTPEVGLGMISGWTGVCRLAEIVGVARARELTLLGSPISAEKAYEWGLLNAVADDPDTMEIQIEAWLRQIFANSGAAMALTKSLLQSMHADFSLHHAAAAGLARSTEDSREGIAAFRAKRKPVFRNR